jgi:hypothetical protein
MLNKKTSFRCAFVSLAILVIGAGTTVPCGHASEVRTYQFVPDGSLPYNASCGECAGTLAGARADIEGKFSVALDLEAGTGSLLSLDNKLVNYFEVHLTQNGLVQIPSAGPRPDMGIIPPWWTSSYALPFSGTLITQGDSLVLSGSGWKLTPDGLLRSVPPFSITIDGNQASFNMQLPINDYEISVSGARAVQLIPEPSTLLLTIAALAALGVRRRKSSSQNRA